MSSNIWYIMVLLPSAHTSRRAVTVLAVTLLLVSQAGVQSQFAPWPSFGDFTNQPTFSFGGLSSTLGAPGNPFGGFGGFGGSGNTSLNGAKLNSFTFGFVRDSSSHGIDAAANGSFDSLRPPPAFFNPFNGASGETSGLPKLHNQPSHSTDQNGPSFSVPPFPTGLSSRSMDNMPVFPSPMVMPGMQGFDEFFRRYFDSKKNTSSVFVNVFPTPAESPQDRTQTTTSTATTPTTTTPTTTTTTTTKTRTTTPHEQPMLVEVNLIRFENPDDKKADGTWCDPTTKCDPRIYADLDTNTPWAAWLGPHVTSAGWVADGLYGLDNTASFDIDRSLVKPMCPNAEAALLRVRIMDADDVGGDDLMNEFTCYTAARVFLGLDFGEWSRERECEERYHPKPQMKLTYRVRRMKSHDTAESQSAASC